MSRRRNSSSLEIKIHSRNQKPPKDLQCYLSNPQNKVNLVNYVFQTWSETFQSKLQNNQLLVLTHLDVSTTEITCQTSTKVNWKQITRGGGADSKMFVFCKYMMEVYNVQRIIIASPDTDVAVIACYQFVDSLLLLRELWLKTGLGTKRRYMKVKMQTCTYMKVKIQTCTYMKVKIQTCTYMKVKIQTCTYMKVKIQTCTYMKVKIQTCTYMKVKIQTCTYMKVKIQTCTYMKVKIQTCTYMKVKIQTCTYMKVHSSSSVKFLGITFDSALTFRSHFRTAASLARHRLLKLTLSSLQPMVPLPLPSSASTNPTSVHCLITVRQQHA